MNLAQHGIVLTTTLTTTLMLIAHSQMFLILKRAEG